MSNDSILTQDERIVLSKIFETWNAFIDLPELNDLDTQGFEHALYTARNIVMSRAYIREQQEGYDE